MSNLNAEEYKTFESIKHVRDNGTEFWYARELAKVLEYAQWRNFQKVIDRAVLACKNSGFEVADHFAEVSKTIEMPKNAKILDYMGSTELIANLFRISQTEEKLKRDEVSTAAAANNTHYEVAEKIRKAIIEMGATLPEDLPVPEKRIQTIEREEIRKLRNSKKKLMLDE